jgi:ribonuclease HI
MILLYIDGGTRRCEICLVDRNKSDKVIVKKRNGALTNNELEYLALIYALEYINNNYSDKPVLICSDSMLIVNQINGKWRVTTEHLIPLYEKAIKKMNKLTKITWVRRNRNLAGIYLEKGRLT